MKIAAIDVGSNSFHLLIAQVGSDGNLTPIDRSKELVRLGDSAFRGGISADAISRSVETLKRFRGTIDRHSCDATLAIATSAVREAENGGDFVRTVRDETGIEITVVPGDEEARRIYLGARSTLDLRTRRALIVDIGGGSVELIVGDASHVHFLASLKLGVLRLLDEWRPSDPVKPDERQRLAERIHRAFEEPLAQARKVGFDVVLMTSGTARAIADLVPSPAGENRPKRVRFGALYALEERLCSLASSERLKLPGLDPKRADSVVVGTMVARTLLEGVHADEYVLSDGALREGMLIDYAARNQPGLALIDEFPDRRRRAVVSLMRRCHVDVKHAEQVAHLALDLFRGTRPLHSLPNSDGELLEFSALLHDIGYHIAPSKHHKHGAYLIENVGLEGFLPEEVQLLSSLVRYHRKATPREGHEPYGRLPEKQRERVRVLAGLLRVADGLDRSCAQRVRGLRCLVHDKSIEVFLTVRGDPELEQWGARRKADLLQEIFAHKLKLVIEDRT